MDESEQRRTSDEVCLVTTRTSDGVDYEAVLEFIGPTGKCSLLILVALFFPCISSGMVAMSYIFTSAIPSYRCLVPGCDNQTAPDFSPVWLNNTVPTDNLLVNPTSGKCQRWNHTWHDVQECITGSDTGQTLLSCDRWIFDTSVYQSTIVTEFQLFCGDEWRKTLVMTLYMIGMLIGFASVGSISDAIGRRATFTMTVAFLGCVFTLNSLATNFSTFAALTVLSGAGGSGLYLTVFVWGVEEFGSKQRAAAGVLLSIFWSLGAVAVGIGAYFLRQWRDLQLLCGLPLFLQISYYWLIPESTRWLIAKKKYSEARLNIDRAARVNAKMIPSHMFQPVQQLIDPANAVDTLPITEGLENLCHALRSSTLFKRLLVALLCWFAVAMSAYGLAFTVINLSGNVFINFGLQSIVSIPGKAAGFFLMDYCGRRTTLVGCLLLSGVGCFVSAYARQESVKLAFLLVASSSTSCSFPVVYCYTAELFPTPVRGAVTGACSTFSRIGAILAPIIESTHRSVSPQFPFIVFGCVNLSCGLLALLLPETKGARLPANVHEAVHLDKFRLRFRNNRSATDQLPIRMSSLESNATLIAT